MSLFRSISPSLRWWAVCFFGALIPFQISAEPSIVSVQGHQLIVRKRSPDGTLQQAAPYTIHGVNWSAAGRETDGSLEERRAALQKWAEADAPLLRQMNVNTVKLYLDPGLDADGLAALDELYDAGIMVILTADDGINDLDRVRRVVQHYKNHPAVLLWMLGNEWNINRYYGREGCQTVEQAARCTETAAALIKSLDANHPVASSYGEIDINAPGLRLADTARAVRIAKSVDVWALNIYRGPDFGSLFEQWRSISSKPMLIGEFGTDTLRNSGTLKDETMQADWDLCLWNDLLPELSAPDPSRVALGGLVFEWNDEWWKVDPPGRQDRGGFSLPAGHPDGFANEEYFGVVDIDRQPRRAFAALAEAFRPDYVRPPGGLVFSVVSRGAYAGEHPGQLGGALFHRCGRLIYYATGGGGRGRGFNVVALDPATGALVGSPGHFDTYITRQRCADDTPGADMDALAGYLNALPDGSLVLIAVGDEAGLTRDDSCTPYASSACFRRGLTALESLGARRLRDYCFRDSWALIAIKGEGKALAEGLGHPGPVFLRTGLPASCTPTETALCLNRGRFQVSAAWQTPQGGSGEARAVPLTEDTGYFWFFDPRNVEMVVKVLDGCALTSRYWIFAGGLTNVDVRMTVRDTKTGEVRTYHNPAGTPFRPIQDTDAFATCP